MRLPFLTATIFPYLLGLVLASYLEINFFIALSIFFSLVFLHIGTNLANDYFDYKYDADNLNKSYSKFSGGSRSIQNKEIKPKNVLLASILFFILGAILGVIIAIMSKSQAVFLIGVFGLLSGYFYTAGPIKLAYRGLGELFIALNLGPLITIGTYLALGASLNLEVLLISLPLGILMFCMIIFNEFPDMDSDKKAGKKVLVVRVGKKNALKIYMFSLSLNYLLIAIGIIYSIFPVTLLIVFLSLPLVIKIIKISIKTYKSKDFVHAMKLNILLHSLVGILLIMGYLI